VTSSHLETENKYEAGAAFLLPGLGGLGTATAPRLHRLHATYYDTDDLALARHRITLRRRTGGTDDGWHLKLPVRAGTRQELRAPLDEGAGEVPAELAARVAAVTAGRPLRPVATIDTERSVVTVTGPDGAVLAEVADDRVTGTRLGVPGARPLRWREIEVEAGSQGAAAAAAVRRAGRLLRAAGARPSRQASKLGRVLGSRNAEGMQSMS
jgi:inorganic triphosphatase YgiF